MMNILSLIGKRFSDLAEYLLRRHVMFFLIFLKCTIPCFLKLVICARLQSVDIMD